MRSVHLKSLLLALLLINALTFLFRGEWNDSFDSLAWIVLMLLYEIQSGNVLAMHQLHPKLPWIRNLAVLVVVVAETSYLFEGAWLDGVYSLLWLLVVVLFELESRFKQQVVASPWLFRTAAAVLALGMAGVILAWMMNEAYFNAYDGLIWSFAFLIIDLDLMASALGPKHSTTRPEPLSLHVPTD